MYAPDPGSFRDPSGRVFIKDSRVLRAIYDGGRDNFAAAERAGVIAEMVNRGWLLEARPVDEALLAQFDPVPDRLIEHPRIPFISYPYEWTFSQLKAAALLHLSMHLALLDDGFTLSDATAYNVQFRGTEPIFIDHLSIVPYVEGDIWAGHRQFCMQFLNPLILWARLGVAPNSWFRGSLEGIAPEDLAPLLRHRDKLSFTILAHVLGQAKAQRRALATETVDRTVRHWRLPRRSLIAMLAGLKDFIGRLELAGGRSVWSDYAEANSYDRETREAKHGFVARFAADEQPPMLFDIGCNSGDFSATALEAGARSVVAFDFDYGALEKAFARFSASGQPALPLWLDAANPSPSQGWCNAERASLAERGEADAMIALAVIHHLAIGRNVPLDMAVDWLVGLAPSGIIEFPSKADPMVRKLLANRTDIFPHYTEDAFLAHVGRRAEIIDQCRLGEGGRLLIRYRRRPA